MFVALYLFSAGFSFLITLKEIMVLRNTKIKKGRTLLTAFPGVHLL